MPTGNNMETATLEVKAVFETDSLGVRGGFSDEDGDSALARLSKGVISRLEDYVPEKKGSLSQRAMRYIAWALKPEEIDVVLNMPGYKNPLDILSIAVINHMPGDILEKYGKSYVQKDSAAWREYTKIHANWMVEEKYLLWSKLRREPSSEEVQKDWENSDNSRRCRAFIVMRRREIMKRV